MTEKMHELAPHHLPFFIPKADGSDQMMVTVLIFLVVVVLLLGTFYLYLHSLPERLAHKHGRIQFELVAVLGLLALFTHNQIFWVAALVLAFIQLPDFVSPLETIANSANRIARKFDGKSGEIEDPYEVETDTPTESGGEDSARAPEPEMEAAPPDEPVPHSKKTDQA